jgi:nucleotide-binding universal stress UspA family protein
MTINFQKKVDNSKKSRTFVKKINTMYKILIPTDFSQNSLKALDYVVENIKNISVEIILVWVNGIRSKDILLPESEEMATERAAIECMKKIIEDYSPKLKEGSRMDYHIRQGRVHLEVANQAKYDDVDMLVCSTHGASGFEEAYIGSNAYRLVMHCKKPIVTVRPNYRFQVPSKIFVMPIDSSPETRQKVPFTCELAKITGSEVHVLGVQTSNDQSTQSKVSAYVAQVANYLSREGVKATVAFKPAGNITKATIAYAQSVDADLISIMNEQESSSWSLLLGTYAQQMLSSASMPVLTNTSRKLMKLSSFS